MLKQNKNRGAGLVTVVVVLAVASILLSGAIFLAFNHYRNVINDEIAEEALTEIQLCAEVICVELGSKELSSVAFLKAFEDGSFVHLYFAGLNKSEYDELTKPIGYFRITDDGKSVVFANFAITNIALEEDDEVPKLIATISCGDYARSVSFYHNGGKWSLVPPEVSDDEP